MLWILGISRGKVCNSHTSLKKKKKSGFDDFCEAFVYLKNKLPNKTIIHEKNYENQSYKGVNLIDFWRNNSIST